MKKQMVVQFDCILQMEKADGKGCFRSIRFHPADSLPLRPPSCECPDPSPIPEGYLKCEPWELGTDLDGKNMQKLDGNHD